MNIPGFTTESLQYVSELLYAEDPLLGECGQRKKKEQQQNQKERTPAQQAADRARGQSQRGVDSTPSAVRSEAAKKAAQTRRKCKGLPQQPAQSTTAQTPQSK